MIILKCKSLILIWKDYSQKKCVNSSRILSNITGNDVHPQNKISDIGFLQMLFWS